MITTNEILTAIADDLDAELAGFQPPEPATLPAHVSQWLLNALLQKSIRRQRTDLAVAAAQRLLTIKPDRLWQRLAVVACEDIGVGGWRAVELTMAAAAHRRRLAKRYGDERIACFIVAKLSVAAKCRASDDMFSLSENDPATEHDRLELADVPFGKLIEIATDASNFVRSAIAIRYALGTDREYRTSNLAKRRGSPAAFFDALADRGYRPSVVEICREAYRRTGEHIAGFLPLLCQRLAGENETRSDMLPEEATIRCLPSWCLDMFSRDGGVALRQFLKTDCATARWLAEHVPAPTRTKAFGHALFRVESGLVAYRLIWQTGVELRAEADRHYWPLGPDHASTLLDLLRKDIPILNVAREATYGR